MIVGSESGKYEADAKDRVKDEGDSFGDIVGVSDLIICMTISISKSSLTLRDNHRFKLLWYLKKCLDPVPVLHVTMARFNGQRVCLPVLSSYSDLLTPPLETIPSRVRPSIWMNPHPFHPFLVSLRIEPSQEHAFPPYFTKSWDSLFEEPVIEVRSERLVYKRRKMGMERWRFFFERKENSLRRMSGEK